MGKVLLPQEPHIEGPTWRRYDDGTFYLPEKSLGWDILNWWATYLRSPDGSGPFLATLEQARWLLWWFAVDSNGKFLYRQATLRRLKGWGKDPFAAALALVELCGPVTFSHFNIKGEPVGKPRFAAWVQLAAVSYEQTRNTNALFPALITDRLKKEYGLEVNRTLIYSAAGGRIESITSSPYAAEGNRPTFAVINEGQYWFDSNNGHEMSAMIKDNLTKTDGRLLSICNAHVPGEDSVAEQDYDAYQKVKAGRAVDTGVLYDSIEAPADTPVSEIPSKEVDPDGHEQGIKKLREGLEVARGDARWLNIDAIVDSILDIRSSVSESRRKFLNQVNASSDSYLSPAEWDACADVEASLQEGDRITLGFDGSRSSDWTALVACRVEDGLISLIRAWDPSIQPTGEINREDVDATVRATFEKYEVVGFRADTHLWESYVDAWSRDFKRTLKVNACPNNIVAFDMRGGNQKKFTLDCERFLDSVLDKELTHTGDTTLRQHALNARRHPTSWGGLGVRKESKDSSRKIDALVCAVMAYGLRHEFLMSKRNRSRKAVMLR
jgi:phage terminase large subunit-like protein